MANGKEKGMVGVQKSTDGNGGRGYYLSASLVNRLIATIFTTILGIAGYMIVWAVNDSTYKSTQEARIDAMVVDIKELKEAVKPGILPIANERIHNMEIQMNRIEQLLLRMEARNGN